jgi:hypothetical protein
VAFSKNVSSSTDNIGYIIPYPIVEHFLSEYRTAGAYQGVCSPGFYTQPMENPAQQQYLKVGVLEVSGVKTRRSSLETECDGGYHCEQKALQARWCAPTEYLDT